MLLLVSFISQLYLSKETVAYKRKNSNWEKYGPLQLQVYITYSHKYINFKNKSI